MCILVKDIFWDKMLIFHSSLWYHMKQQMLDNHGFISEKWILKVYIYDVTNVSAWKASLRYKALFLCICFASAAVLSIIYLELIIEILFF